MIRKKSRTAPPFAIDAIPNDLRNNAIDRLMSGQSTRDVSAYLADQGIKITHAAVARYKKLVLLPAIATASKVSQFEQLTADEATPLTPIENLTKQVISADPLLDRIEAKYKRLTHAARRSLKEKDFRGYASIEMADTNAIKLHAQLTGRLTEQVNQTTVQIVMNATPTPVGPEIADDDVIDIEPIR